MCLNATDFNMTYDEKRDEFIGVGYKALPATANRRWKEAKGRTSPGPKTLSNFVYDNKGARYFPGFHIFLKLEDAKKYLSADSATYYKVYFKGVTGFGQQRAGTVNCNPNYGPCVIARYMRIVEEVSNAPDAKSV